MSIKITILGCDAADGVPSISEGWGHCNPANPKHNRRRTSILVQYGHTTALVVTSLDLRAQLFDCSV